MQEMVGVHCGCGDTDRRKQWSTIACDRCGDRIPDERVRTVTVRVDDDVTHEFRFCPACLVNWRDRFERDLKPSSHGDDSDSIVA